MANDHLDAENSLSSTGESLSLRHVTKVHIERVLRATKSRRADAAELLGVSPAELDRLIEELAIVVSNTDADIEIASGEEEATYDRGTPQCAE